MNGYVITRDKFMSVKEKSKTLRCCKKEAKADLCSKDKKWVNRYMLIHLALNTGLRVSKIAALKISDVNLNGKENYLVVRHGKGKRKRVFILMMIVEHLKTYITIKQKLWREAIESDAPLFAGRGGNHYTTTALQISFKKAIVKQGFSIIIRYNAPHDY